MRLLIGGAGAYWLPETPASLWAICDSKIRHERAKRIWRVRIQSCKLLAAVSQQCARPARARTRTAEELKTPDSTSDPAITATPDSFARHKPAASPLAAYCPQSIVHCRPRETGTAPDWVLLHSETAQMEQKLENLFNCKSHSYNFKYPLPSLCLSFIVLLCSLHLSLFFVPLTSLLPSKVDFFNMNQTIGFSVITQLLPIPFPFPLKF